MAMPSLSGQIRQKYELGDVLHMTDIENLESILAHTRILSKNQMSKLGKKYIDLSNESVQSGGSNITIECTGKALHDYVPLYWGKKTPMVAVNQDRNERLIFLMFSTNFLGEYDCVICDGNARSRSTLFRKFKALNDLDLLHPLSINTVKYAISDEVKRRKQAEILVLDSLPLTHLLRIVCHSAIAKVRIEALLATHGINRGVYVGAGNYYFKG